MSNPIGWCDKTWNPMTGCTPVSEACEHCYAERMAGRNLPVTRCPACKGEGRVHILGVYDEPTNDPCPRCSGTGNVGFTPTFHPDRLDKPLHWRKPRRVFVCSMSDLFHEAFTDEQRDAVLARIIGSPQHTFMLLTKRPEAARAYLGDEHERCAMLLANWHHLIPDGHNPWPLRNLWLGVTAENQARADERIPILLDTPAVVRFVSVEPMLSAVDLAEYLCPPWCRQIVNEEHGTGPCPDPCSDKLSWVICGGENGPGSRPMQPAWAIDLRRQCKSAGVPFWFKGVGSWWQKNAAWPGSEEATGVAVQELPAVTP